MKSTPKIYVALPAMTKRNIFRIVLNVSNASRIVITMWLFVLINLMNGGTYLKRKIYVKGIKIFLKILQVKPKMYILSLIKVQRQGMERK